MPRRAVLASALLVGALSGAAQARTARTYNYSFDTVYSTAVRFVRIDRSCTITDRDPQAAYLLYECHEGKQVRHGALEIFRVGAGAGVGESVRVQLTLTEEPSYMEVRFLDLLGRKLRDEQGLPPRPPAAPPDAGT